MRCPSPPPPCTTHPHCGLPCTIRPRAPVSVCRCHSMLLLENVRRLPIQSSWRIYQRPHSKTIASLCNLRDGVRKCGEIGVNRMHDCRDAHAYATNMPTRMHTHAHACTCMHTHARTNKIQTHEWTGVKRHTRALLLSCQFTQESYTMGSQGAEGEKLLRPHMHNTGNNTASWSTHVSPPSPASLFPRSWLRIPFHSWMCGE